MMKKLIALLLAMTLCFTMFAGCSKEEAVDEPAAPAVIDYAAAFAKYDPEIVVMTIDGTEVTWSVDFYFLRRTVLHQFIKHKSSALIVNSCCKLAVRICSRTTFAKLDICIFIQFACFEEMLCDSIAFFHSSATLDYYRIKTILSKDKSAEHTCRTKSHHDRLAFHNFIAFYSRNSCREQLCNFILI